MYIAIDVPITTDYLEEFYEQSHSFGYSKYIMLFLKGLGIVAILTCFLLVFLYSRTYNSMNLIVAIIALLAGLYLLFNENRVKKKWIRKAKEEFKKYPTNSWIFEEDRITQITALSKSILAWEVFLSVKETYKGLLFYQNELLALYIPKKCFKSLDEVDAILEHFDKQPTVNVESLSNKKTLKE